MAEEDPTGRTLDLHAGALEPTGQSADPYAILDAIPGAPSARDRSRAQRRQEVPGTSIAGDQLMAYMQAHLGDFDPAFVANPGTEGSRLLLEAAIAEGVSPDSEALDLDSEGLGRVEPFRTTEGWEGLLTQPGVKDEMRRSRAEVKAARKSLRAATDDVSAETPDAVPTRRAPSRGETTRLVGKLTADSDYRARIEQAQADQDAGNLRSLEDVHNVLGIPHEPQEQEAVPEFLQSLPDDVRVEYMDESAHRQAGESGGVPTQASDGTVDERDPEAIKAATDKGRAEIAAGRVHHSIGGDTAGEVGQRLRRAAEERAEPELGLPS